MKAIFKLLLCVNILIVKLPTNKTFDASFSANDLIDMHQSIPLSLDQTLPWCH
jgi:hypothetical protein